jgi:hypothetical protein
VEVTNATVGMGVNDEERATISSVAVGVIVDSTVFD